MDCDREERCNTAAELQDIFNRLFAARLARRELELRKRTSKPARNVNMPPGTTTDIYDLLDQGVEVGVVHAYILPDGTVGGSGLYDPKALLVGRTMYFYRPPDRSYGE